MKNIAVALLLGLCINAYSQTDYSFVYDSQHFLDEGIRLYEDEKYTEAIKEFDKIAKIDPQYTTAQYEKSLALAKGENKDAAKAFYEDALKKGYMDEVPNFYMAYANFLSDQKDYEKSEKMFLQAQKKAPNSNLVLYNMALLYIRQEQRQKAVDMLQQSITINPHHPGSHYLLGLIALEDGHATEGTMALLAYLTLAPTGGGAETAILKLNEKFSENYLDKSKLVFSKAGGDNFEEIDVILRNGLPLKKAYKINSTFDDVIIRQVQAIVEYSAEHKMGPGFFENTYVPWLADVAKKKQFEGFSYYILLGMEQKLGKKLTSQTKKIEAFVENYMTKGYWEVFAKRTMDHFGKQEEVVVFIHDGNPNLIGKVVNGKKQGKYKSLDENGNLTGELNVADDELHGLQKYFEDGRLVEEKNFVNGKLHGKRTTYFENGNVHLVENYKDDMLDGLSTSYYVNGGKRCESIFVKGEMDGDYLCLYENGTRQRELKYANGTLEGRHLNYDKAGNIILDQTYVKGNRVGKAVEYYNGKVVKSEIEYDNNGVTASSHKTYFPNATLSEETFYANDKPESGVSYFSNGKKSSDMLYDKEGYVTTYTYYQSNGEKFFEEQYSKGLIKAGLQYEKGKPKPATVPVKGAYTMKNYDGTVVVKGGYDKGIKTGEWNYFYRMNGSPRIKEYFEKGLQTSKTYNYRTDGRILNIANYVNDTLAGVYEEYDDGQLENVYFYKGGELNGPAKVLYPDGSLSEESFYEEGELAIDYSYWQNGKVQAITKYIDGTPVSMERYNPDGKKEGEVNYANKSGKMMLTFNNGHEVHEYNSINGRVNGKYIVKDKAGKVFIESDFINGLRHGRYFKTGPTGAPDVELFYYAGKLDGVSKYYDLAGTHRLSDTYVLGDNTGQITRYYQNKSKYSEFTQFDDNIEGELKYYNLKGENILILGYENNDIVYYTKLDKDGKLTEKVPVVGGTAKIVSAYANGKPAMEINLVKGNFDGKFAVYSAEGKPEVEVTYDMGLLNGTRTEYYANGKPYKKENFKEGFTEGLQEFFKEDGKLHITAEYKNDEMHGLCRIYNNGIVSQTQRYDSDSLVEIVK